MKRRRQFTKRIFGKQQRAQSPQPWELGCFTNSRSDRTNYPRRVVGPRSVGWVINANVCSRLPMEWNTLYYLARLSRTTLERLIQRGVIHPAMTEREARRLAAQFRGETLKTRSARAILRERLRRFAEFVADHLEDWSADERELATEGLTRLIERMALGGSLREPDPGGKNVVRARFIAAQFSPSPGCSPRPSDGRGVRGEGNGERGEGQGEGGPDRQSQVLSGKVCPEGEGL